MRVGAKTRWSKILDFSVYTSMFGSFQASQPQALVHRAQHAFWLWLRFELCEPTLGLGHRPRLLGGEFNPRLGPGVGLDLG